MMVVTNSSDSSKCSDNVIAALCKDGHGMVRVTVLTIRLKFINRMLQS